MEWGGEMEGWGRGGNMEITATEDRLKKLYTFRGMKGKRNIVIKNTVSKINNKMSTTFLLERNSPFLYHCLPSQMLKDYLLTSLKAYQENFYHKFF